MTGDDLKRMQDGFLDTAKKILLTDGHLRPVGFIVTLHKHLDKLFESGWGIEFLDPKECMRDDHDDNVSVLMLDMAMNWKRLYHAVLNVFPQTQSVLPQMIAIGEAAGIPDVYMHVMRPFLETTQLDVKDIIAATMRQICGKVEAFASIMQSEAWLRIVESPERLTDVPESLGQDKKSVEVIVSALETYDFARLVTTPIHRELSKSKDPSTRDEEKILGFGASDEHLDTSSNTNVMKGRMVRFLKPLKEAS